MSWLDVFRRGALSRIESLLAQITSPRGLIMTAIDDLNTKLDNLVSITGKQAQDLTVLQGDIANARTDLTQIGANVGTLATTLSQLRDQLANAGAGGQVSPDMLAKADAAIAAAQAVDQGLSQAHADLGDVDTGLAANAAQLAALAQAPAAAPTPAPSSPPATPPTDGSSTPPTTPAP
jgi:uncharacterized phage infection (PIP) family protein YhgE